MTVLVQENLKIVNMRIAEILDSVSRIPFQIDVKGWENCLCELSAEMLSLATRKSFCRDRAQALHKFMERGYTKSSLSADALNLFKKDDEDVRDFLKYQSLKRRVSVARKYLMEYKKDPHLYSSYVISLNRGRIFVEGFNYTSLPKEFLKFLVPARKKGYKLVSADLHCFELAVLANLADDEFLRNAVLSDSDFHVVCASYLFHKDPKDITPEERQQSKSMTYGFLYGKSMTSIRDELGLTPAEATKLYDSFHKVFKTSLDYRRSVQKEAFEKGYVDSYLGCRQQILNKDERDSRLAFSHKVQSSAGDIFKLLLLRYSETSLASLGEILLRGVVYDSFIFEIPEDLENERFALMLSDCFDLLFKNWGLKISVKPLGE